MARVTGIGGVFFKAHDRAALIAWYREHLGMGTRASMAAWRSNGATRTG